MDESAEQWRLSHPKNGATGQRGRGGNRPVGGMCWLGARGVATRSEGQGDVSSRTSIALFLSRARV